MMTPERWQSLKESFGEANELAGAARNQYLDDLQARDPSLSSELRALLKDCESANLESGGRFLRCDCDDFPDIFTPGQLVENRYQVIQKLGSGGMGQVYEAIDTRLNDQRIALKTVRP